jgi:BirA family biotin operon repressor/biotin-[acetyl-CoA-carboxylase] ligase
MNWRITRFPLLASTNDLALDWMRSGRAAAGDVLVTEEQLAGRGRPGRTWHSPRGALLVTVVLPFRPERVGWTALAAGAAVASTARELGVAAGVKWPNDVVLDGRKLAGVLAETSVPGLVAIGIGMNVSNPLPDDPALADRTARLADSLPGITPEAVLEALLPQLAGYWALLLAEDLTPLHERWTGLDTTTGRRLRWSQEAVTGTAVGLDAAGGLLIRTDAGRVVAANVGEVSFLD